MDCVSLKTGDLIFEDFRLETDKISVDIDVFNIVTDRQSSTDLFANNLLDTTIRKVSQTVVGTCDKLVVPTSRSFHPGNKNSLGLFRTEVVFDLLVVNLPLTLVTKRSPYLYECHRGPLCVIVGP